MVNRVILIGNLGGAPEIRNLENGASVGRFSLATNENYQDKQGQWQTNTEWHDIIVWRTLADRAAKALTKGTQIYLEGKLTHRKWQDKEGNNRKTTEVVASYFRILSKREGGQEGGGNFPTAKDEQSPATNTPATNQTAPPAVTTQADDLPF